TALHIAAELRERAPDLVVTRLASGLPVGGDREYADEGTLGRALPGRRSILADFSPMNQRAFSDQCVGYADAAKHGQYTQGDFRRYGGDHRVPDRGANSRRGRHAVG